MVWWSGGLVVWWSGGPVVWWSGGLVVGWSGLGRREAASSRKTLYHKIAQGRREAASSRKTLCHKNFISHKFCITYKNFWGLRLGIIFK